MAQLASATRARLGAMHPFDRRPDDPIDAWPAMERHGTAVAMPEIADAVFHDPGVDAVVLGMSAYSGGGAEFRASMVGGALRQAGCRVLPEARFPISISRMFRQLER